MKTMVLKAEWGCGSGKTTPNERISGMVMPNVIKLSHRHK